MEDAYVFTRQKTLVDKLKKEKSKFIKRTPLPLKIAGAIKFRGQAQIHPTKCGYGLAQGILDNNGRIFENSKVTEIKRENRKIVRIKNEKVGVYKSQTGEIYKVKPYCTHLGCQLHFNNIDKTWECPCHGSKFSYDGKLIEVPSNKDLK